MAERGERRQIAVENFLAEITFLTVLFLVGVVPSVPGLFTLAFLVLALASFHRCLWVCEKTHEKKWADWRAWV